MEEPLQIQTFERIPSAEEFASQIEPRNAPAVIKALHALAIVFRGCARDWKAFSKWNVLNGGLDYLRALVGSSVVEAMLSRTAPTFYGDIRSHDRVQLPFTSFVGYCKNLLQNKSDSPNSTPLLRKHDVLQQDDDFDPGEESPQQVYLAQVSILNRENKERVQLEALREDIGTPAFLEGKVIDSINLWMNNARTRSSTHYDPHHNLLCIVSGYKQVSLWSPSATPFLYPLPIYGESSNHSAVLLENPNFSLYPRAKSVDECSQKVNLHAGDAVFIPEGWFHQVDSRELTIAVNFWWQSDMMSGMLEHMDAYYLRRILKRLTDKEMDRVLPMPSTAMDKRAHANHLSSAMNAGSSDQDSDSNNQAVSVKTKPEQEFSLHVLEPNALRSLHELVFLVHERVNQSQPVGNLSADLDNGMEKEGDIIATCSLFNLEEDPIANIIWNLEPRTFQRVFRTIATMSWRSQRKQSPYLFGGKGMTAYISLSPDSAYGQVRICQHNFPKTLEAFVLGALSPVGVEVLTRKFEQMDQIIQPEDRSQFYQQFYNVFDNQSSAMDALLNGKESFACQAFHNVLARYLGIDVVEKHSRLK